MTNMNWWNSKTDKYDTHWIERNTDYKHSYKCIYHWSKWYRAHMIGLIRQQLRIIYTIEEKSVPCRIVAKSVWLSRRSPLQRWHVLISHPIKPISKCQATLQGNSTYQWLSIRLAYHGHALSHLYLSLKIHFLSPNISPNVIIWPSNLYNCSPLGLQLAQLGLITVWSQVIKGFNLKNFNKVSQIKQTIPPQWQQAAITWHNWIHWKDQPTLIFVMSIRKVW